MSEDWGLISAKLTNYAHKRTGRRSIDRAQEIAQEAIARHFDGSYAAWDPNKESLFLHLTSIVNSLAYGDRVKSSTNHEKRVTTASMARAVERTASPDATAEDDLVARDFHSRAWTDVRARAANDALVTKLTDLWQDGVDAPAEQAAALGVPIAEVRNARRRLFTHVETVVRALTEAP